MQDSRLTGAKDLFLIEILKTHADGRLVLPAPAGMRPLEKQGLIALLRHPRGGGAHALVGPAVVDERPSMSDPRRP